MASFEEADYIRDYGEYLRFRGVPLASGDG
jgi:hypothetical protein